MSNRSTRRGATDPVVRVRTRRRGRLWIVPALVAFLASVGEANFRLGGLAVDDPSTREVVERHTLARKLRTVRVAGSVRTAEWLLDRPRLAATLARHLHPGMEPYHVVRRDDGSFDVSDVSALRGSFRLVTRGENRRVYYCQGQFRSLAHLLQLTGNMVFTLEYRDVRDGAHGAVDVAPQLYVRLDSILAHGLMAVLGPLLDGVIDRRVASITTASQSVAARIARDPERLYHEMATWKDIAPDDLEAYRTMFVEGGRQ